ncbi:GntR family transcriptional regulator [Alicyclobacillus tolerans]|uniref:GntR family transcriptional regulator n=1 Tax=Alicyclobacillus tolerans TaxID=90970 RepID=UPI001F22CEE7|nr:GntR family transcriptional regulator [Alicyclobacillus tolerans]MCF8566844.1 GntR family transcriptional regulator [Alicyclobacillus tolerans]
MKQGKTNFAYETIKEKICSGQLKPLSDISEDALCEELGISRTPIREALQKLEKEKFIYIYPRKGMIVSGITIELIHYISEVRESIEPFVAKAVCGRLLEPWLLQMRSQFMAGPPMTSPEDRKVYYSNLDGELHHTVIHTHPNFFIHNIMNNILDHTRRIRNYTSTVNETYNVSISEHIGIIDAFLERDAEKVERLVRSHIVNARKNSILYLYGLESSDLERG